MAHGAGGTGGLQPEGEALRSALRWLDARVQDDPRADRARLVGEASTRFDLSPLDEEFLLRNWARPPP
jgi:hypothetical protein